MLYSLAIIFILGLIIINIFEKIKIPGLVGLIILGIILGRENNEFLSDDFINLAGEFRSLALVIILSRAGLALNISDLKIIGRPAFYMTFIPATCEIIACTIIAPLLFKISYLDAAIMGCVLAAVSPAVIVPQMLKIIKEGYGQKNKVPQLIMAGSAIDDIFVIVIFTSLLNFNKNNSFNILNLLQIPFSIAVGIIIGMIFGFLIVKLFNILKANIYSKTLLMLSFSFLLLHIESNLPENFKISALLAIMSLGACILFLDKNSAKQLSEVYESIWLPASIILFVLVGTSINYSSINYSITSIVILIVGALIFRTGGVILSLSSSALNKREKLFCIYSYLPKATVQAALSSIPLSVGIKSGGLILVVGISSILLTAPVGSFLINQLYKKHLKIDL